MTSRMDRYFDDKKENNRSNKNKSLYEEIQNLDSYTNIEAVATIERTNEIDLTRVKQLLKNRENYKKEKKYIQALNKQKGEEEAYEEQVIEPEKSYDINEALNIARENRGQDNSKHHTLNKEQYEVLKSLQTKNDFNDDEDKLKELINTITHNSELNKLAGTDTDLFSDLKSDTMVGNADSIKEIIEEEKNKYEDTENLDKSFFTSSLGIKPEDFEDLKSINNNIKKNNNLIKILFITILLLIVAFTVYFIVF